MTLGGFLPAWGSRQDRAVSSHQSTPSPGAWRSSVPGCVRSCPWSTACGGKHREPLLTHMCRDIYPRHEDGPALKQSRSSFFTICTRFKILFSQFKPLLTCSFQWPPRWQPHTWQYDQLYFGYLYESSSGSTNPSIYFPLYPSTVYFRVHSGSHLALTVMGLLVLSQ